MIPFLDLKSINLRHAAELRDAFDRVLNSGWFTLGEELTSFEAEFAQYCSVDHCIGISDGLNALRLVLQAWGIGPGDEVIVPSNTFIATWFAVSQVGAKPIPVEPDSITMNIDPCRIEAAITSKTRAIIPVHLYGQPADMAPIMDVAQKHGLHVLEDAAQSHGARYHGQRTGGLGHAAAFSFYPTKNLGALGDGGAITTNDSSLAAKVRELRNYGSTKKYIHTKIGWNARLDELQAAFLKMKLRYLDRDNAHRANIAEIYLNGLAGTGLELPRLAPQLESSWHLFVVRSKYRDQLQFDLKAEGIETLIHYPIPPHLQAAYANDALTQNMHYPIANRSSQEALSLPIGPTLSEQDAICIVEVLRKLLAEKP